MTKLKTLTPHRDFVEAPCEYASHCGGCKTQNLLYEAQIRAKEQQVRDLIVHVGRFDDRDPDFAGVLKPIVPCDVQFHYRNKVRSGVGVACLGFCGVGCGKGDVFTVFCRWNSHLELRDGCREMSRWLERIKLTVVLHWDCMHQDSSIRSSMLRNACCRAKPLTR